MGGTGDEAPASLHFSTSGSVARIRLDRPSVGNALDLPLAHAFAAAVGAADSEPDVLIIVISAAGKLFCGGGDLAAVAQADDPQRYMADLADTFHAGLEILARSKCIVVGVQQGPAAGGGLGLILNCDYVVASTRASFSSAYALVGLTPDSGVSYLLPRTIGPRRANQMCLFGRIVDAPTALDWGLVDEVVEPENLEQASERIVAQLIGSATHVLGETKRLLAAGSFRSYPAHLADESATISSFTGHEDSASRIRAFTERRR